jgi:hypothetical protein
MTIVKICIPVPSCTGLTTALAGLNLAMTLKVHIGSVNIAMIKTPRPYHHGDLRRALLDAAAGTLKTTGPDGLSLRQLA